MVKAVATLGPVIEILPEFVLDQYGFQSSVVMVAHRTGTTHSYFTGIPDVYRAHGMYATHKFVEPFSNNMVCSIWPVSLVLFLVFSSPSM
jgi:hypothetical protein